MVRMRLMLATALTLATVLAACGGSGDPADDRTPATAAEGVRTDQQALVGTWETRSMSTGEHIAAGRRISHELRGAVNDHLRSIGG
jgi:ABC-type glycerol-3-phosphate transport system substrate-binding protein